MGDTKGPTYLAFGNSEQRVIIIPAAAKREIITWLRAKKKFKPASYYRIFAAGLFLLLKDHLAKATTILIDNEYKGHEGKIKDMLLDFAQRFGQLDRHQLKEKIAIVSLPKRNPADQLIHRVHEKRQAYPSPEIIHARQLKRFFK